MTTTRTRTGSPAFTVLGLQFGHDAAAAVVQDGRVRSYVPRERYCRIKHAMTLDVGTIETAITQAGMSVGDIDCVAITSTQRIELVIREPDRLDIRYRGRDPFERPVAALDRFAGSDHAAIAATGSRLLLDMLYGGRFADTNVASDYAKAFPEHAVLSRDALGAVPWLDTYLVEPAWDSGLRLAQLGDVTPTVSERHRYGFHVPVSVRLDDHELPGYAIHHHLAHAASSYYQSGFGSAGVLTHDGFGTASIATADCNSGMFYLGEGAALYPLWPHRLTAGFLYEHVAYRLGLGVVGGAGKLMGLAAYGQPRFFDPGFVGNSQDFDGRWADMPEAWVAHCREAAGRQGYDTAPFGDPGQATAAVNADTAASTQLLFEAIRQAAVNGLDRQLRNAGRPQTALCLSGGTALNCPSNTAIANSGRFSRVFVEPACDDSGIAVGAALAAYHSVLDHPRPTPARPATAYLGRRYSDHAVTRALALVDPGVAVSHPADAAAQAAADVAAGLIIGWCEGRAEAGPRALGHRSIVADPRDRGMWARVNQIKGREWWRPLAPAVLGEHAAEWFTGGPLPSPHMLFNFQVRRAGLPAVTHLDRTARIQTVGPETGGFHRLLSEFHRRTGVPVVLNTSFNGPGEPIVETPTDAVDCFVRLGLDVLYLNGRRVVRTGAEPPPAAVSTTVVAEPAGAPVRP
jgi:carbamoyltransferase